MSAVKKCAHYASLFNDVALVIHCGFFGAILIYIWMLVRGLLYVGRCSYSIWQFSRRTVMLPGFWMAAVCIFPRLAFVLVLATLISTIDTLATDPNHTWHIITVLKTGFGGLGALLFISSRCIFSHIRGRIPSAFENVLESLSLLKFMQSQIFCKNIELEDAYIRRSSCMCIVAAC